MTEVETSRRALIKTAVVGVAAFGPLGLLGGCKDDLGSASGLSVVPEQKAASFAAAATSSGKSEADYWSAAVGQSFKITGPEGPMYAILTAVEALTVEGARPSSLRAQPLVATFSFDRGYKPVGETLYALVKGRESETQLFLQRAGTAEVPTLVAQFN